MPERHPSVHTPKGTEYEFIFVDSSLVICRSFGVASVQGFVDSAEALTSDPKWRPGMDTISDHTHLDMSQLTCSDVEQIAGGEGEYSDEIGKGRGAIVIGRYSPASYGFARMFEAFIEPFVEATFRAFWTLDEALVWLRGPDYSLPAGYVKSSAVWSPRRRPSRFRAQRGGLPAREASETPLLDAERAVVASCAGCPRDLTLNAGARRWRMPAGGGPWSS